MAILKFSSVLIWRCQSCSITLGESVCHAILIEEGLAEETNGGCVDASVDSEVEGEVASVKVKLHLSWNTLSFLHVGA